MGGERKMTKKKKKKKLINIVSVEYTHTHTPLSQPYDVLLVMAKQRRPAKALTLQDP